jgi:hypothetical protein
MMIKHFTCAVGALMLAAAPFSARAESVEAMGSTNGSAGSSSVTTSVTGLISPTEANGSGSASGSVGTNPLAGYLDLQNVDLPDTNALLGRIDRSDNKLNGIDLSSNLSILKVADLSVAPLDQLDVVGTLSSSVTK